MSDKEEVKKLDLQQKLEKSQDALKAHIERIAELSKERDALQQQVNALAAENLDLKHPGTYLPSKRETPATDAIKRQWMAEGVRLAKNKLAAMGDVSYAPYELDVLADGLLRQPEEKGQ